MFKILSKVAVVAIAVVAFSSCASVSTTAPVMGLSGEPIEAKVSAVLDLANAKRVQAEVTKNTNFGISSYSCDNKTLKSSNRYKGISNCEGRALNLAKEQGNVDVILDPEFTTEKHSWFFGLFKKQVVSVKGWGVNIKGFK